MIVSPPDGPVLTKLPVVNGAVLQSEKNFCGPDDTALIGAEAESAEALTVNQVPGSVESVAAACSRCPPGQPQCTRDRDCDKICGKISGSCLQINSCYTCCTCAF